MAQPENIDKLLKDLQGTTAFKRGQAARQLGSLTESDERIVEALIATKESDSYDNIREAAAKALLAPVHQAIISQHPKWAMYLTENLTKTLQEDSSKALSEDLLRRQKIAERIANRNERAEQEAFQAEQKLSVVESAEDQSGTSVSFRAKQMGVPFRVPQWKVLITPELVEFTNMNGKGHISIPKEQGEDCIEFASAFVSGFNVKLNQGGKEYKLRLASKDLDKLRFWMIPKTASEVASDIKQALIIRGIGLILVGIASFVFSNYLDPIWGGGLVILGVLNFFISSRYMFLATGIVLIGCNPKKWAIAKNS